MITIRIFPAPEKLIQAATKQWHYQKKTEVKRKQSPGRKKEDHTNNNNTDKKDTAISTLHAAIAKATKERLALESETRDNLQKWKKLS